MSNGIKVQQWANMFSEWLGKKHSRTYRKVNKRWQPARNPWIGTDDK